jgi:hypothetical protein
MRRLPAWGRLAKIEGDGALAALCCNDGELAAGGIGGDPALTYRADEGLAFVGCA